MDVLFYNHLPKTPCNPEGLFRLSHSRVQDEQAKKQAGPENMRHSGICCGLCPLVLAVLLLVCTGCASRSSLVNSDLHHKDQHDKVDHVQRGTALIEKAEYDQAILEFTEALENNPRSPYALSSRAVAYARIGEFDAAIKDLTCCIDDGYAVLPAFGLGPSLYFSRGSVFITKGDLTRGMADYRSSIQVSLDLLAKLKNQEPAPGQWVMLDMSPLPLKNLMRTYYARANVHRQMGDAEKEQKDLEQYDRYRREFKATQGSPRRQGQHNKAVDYYNQGLNNAHRGRYDRAIADLTNAIKLRPDHAEAYYNRGLAYAAKGQYDRAIADLTNAIELNPEFVKAYYIRGKAYYEKSEYPRARRDWERAVELDPTGPTGRDARHDLEALRWKTSSIAGYTKAIELRPDHAEAYYHRGLAYAAKGQSDRAIADFTKAVDLKPDYADVYNQRGSVYYNESQYPRARRDWERAIELDPTGPAGRDARHNLEVLRGKGH